MASRNRPKPESPGPRLHADGRKRCSWCSDDPLYVDYHDHEWGVPQHSDRRLFEMLCLEGAQAGLSWLTVLRKRPAYRQAFEQFDARSIAAYGPVEQARLLECPGIIRNRLKVAAFIDNARAYLGVLERCGSFDRYIWQFTDGRTLKRRPLRQSAILVSTPASAAMSKQLKRDGFRFVGPTICYAFMQAVGMVDEHQRHCWIARAGRAQLEEPSLQR